MVDTSQKRSVMQLQNTETKTDSKRADGSTLCKDSHDWGREKGGEKSKMMGDNVTQGYKLCTLITVSTHILSTTATQVLPQPSTWESQHISRPLLDYDYSRIFSANCEWYPHYFEAVKESFGVAEDEFPSLASIASEQSTKEQCYTAL